MRQRDNYENRQVKKSRLTDTLYDITIICPQKREETRTTFSLKLRGSKQDELARIPTTLELHHHRQRRSSQL
jgi:hypothetical protein